MMSKMTFAEGDIIIINDKTKVSLDYNIPILENNTPYEVDYVLSESEGFYIVVYGKPIRIFESDIEHIEHIPIGNRVDDAVEEVFLWDTVTILDDEKIEGALHGGFRTGLTFEVSKIVDDESIVIKYGQKELWIRKDEFRYVKINKNDPIAANMPNLQKDIDDALDNKDFKKVEDILKMKGKLKKNFGSD